MDCSFSHVKNCGSGIHVYPKSDAHVIQCDVCNKEQKVEFNEAHCQNILKECPDCRRRDFLFPEGILNRKIGVLLFVIAAIFSVFTYGISLIVLWMIDFFLFKRLSQIAICYKCQTIFRQVDNIGDIRPFDHEMNDRIVYADHDFKGNSLS